MTLTLDAGAVLSPAIPPDVEAGSLVYSVQSAVDALEDGLCDPDIRASLSGLDAYSLEKVIERLQLVIEEIDNGPC